MFWFHGCWVSCHTMQSEVMCCRMHYRYCVYRLLLMFLIHRFFVCWLLSIRPDITMVWMFILYYLFFLLSHDTPWSIASMAMLKSWTIRLVTYVEFDREPYSSTITCFYGCCSFFNVVRTNQMICIEVNFDAVAKDKIIIVFSQNTVKMEVKSLT